MVLGRAVLRWEMVRGQAAFEKFKNTYGQLNYDYCKQGAGLLPFMAAMLVFVAVTLPFVAAKIQLRYWCGCTHSNGSAASMRGRE